MPRARTGIALVTIIALTLVLTLPVCAFAQDGLTQKSVPPVTAKTRSPFSTTEQRDGTIADELALAVIATAVGCAFVVFVFSKNRDGS